MSKEEELNRLMESLRLLITTRKVPVRQFNFGMIADGVPIVSLEFFATPEAIEAISEVLEKSETP